MKAEAYLLDTHGFLWWQAGDARFSEGLRPVLENQANTIFVSAVTCWEISTKYRQGKLAIDPGIARDIEAEVMKWGMTPLPITFAHAQRTSLLPYFHKDPFDRLLIAQAMVEGLVLISRDGMFDRYGVARLW